MSTPSKSRSPPAEQHSRQCEMHFIHQSGAQVLMDGVASTADAHVAASGRLACAIQCVMNAAGNEMERGATLHLHRRARVVRQYEGGNMVRRTVTPPAIPLQVQPGSADRAEHVPPQDPRADIPEAARGEIIVVPVVPPSLPSICWKVRVGYIH